MRFFRCAIKQCDRMVRNQGETVRRFDGLGRFPLLYYGQNTQGGFAMSMLEVSGLKKIYKTRFDGNQVEALRSVSFQVEQG